MLYFIIHLDRDNKPEPEALSNTEAADETQAASSAARGFAARPVHFRSVDATLVVLEDGRQLILIPQDWD